MRASLQFLLATISLSAFCGCDTMDNPIRREIESHYVITYYDRNHDGVVDFELHRVPGGADTDWALSDTRFRGHYDLRISWGYALEKKPVNLPVATHVPITPGQPPVSEIK